MQGELDFLAFITEKTDFLVVNFYEGKGQTGVN